MEILESIVNADIGRLFIFAGLMALLVVVLALLAVVYAVRANGNQDNISLGLIGLTSSLEKTFTKSQAAFEGWNQRLSDTLDTVVDTQKTLAATLDEISTQRTETVRIMAAAMADHNTEAANRAGLTNNLISAVGGDVQATQATASAGLSAIKNLTSHVERVPAAISSLESKIDILKLRNDTAPEQIRAIIAAEILEPLATLETDILSALQRMDNSTHLSAIINALNITIEEIRRLNPPSIPLTQSVPIRIGDNDKQP